MQKNDFMLQHINRDIEEQLHNQHDLYFCKVLAHAIEDDLSITAQYVPPKDYYSLAEDNDIPASGFYYGVSPCLDEKELIRCISNLELTTSDDLNKYIEKHGDWFMAHPAQKEYLPALARYIVICMTNHFGIRIRMERQEFKKLTTHLADRGYSENNMKALLSYSEDENQEIRPEQPILTINGCPSKDVLDFLEKYKYTRLCKKDKNAIQLIDAKGKRYGTVDAWNLVCSDTEPETSKNIRKVYSESIDLIVGRVFYSGVLLKPVRLESISGSKENDRIRTICIHFERSTYGTVCALDRNLTEHPLLQEVKPAIIEMLQSDDNAKRTLNEELETIEKTALEDLEASVRMIDVINKYLGSCFNVNQIGVSANIVTRDGLLLFGQRSQGNIDEGKLYPGANGNAEIADRNVSFYSMSVYADYPTIRLDSDRIDFFDEIGREAYGELKIDLPKQEWVCTGIIISGNIPLHDAECSDYQESYRRMHFNLIFEHHSDKTFDEIEKSSITAAEAFETKHYLGVKVVCERNILLYLGKTIIKGIISIVSKKDFIEAAVAIIVFLLTIAHTAPGENADAGVLFHRLLALHWTEAVALIISLLVIILTCGRSLLALRRYIHRRKRIRLIQVYRKLSYQDVNARVASAWRIHKCKKELFPFHPVAYACLRSFVDGIICDTFFPKDRR